MKHRVFWPLLSTFVFLLCGASLSRANNALSPDVFALPAGLQKVENNQAMVPKELSPETMQHIRGKFVAGNKIAWFGLVMLTTVQTNQGALIQAGGQLTIQKTDTLTAKFQPIVSIRTIPITQQTTPTGNIVNNSGIFNASGIVQSVQVAGDDNVVGQDAQIRIAAGNTNPSDYANMFNGVGSQNQLSQAKNGIIASSTLNQDGIAIKILVPGTGEVMQALRSGLGSGGRGLFQSTQLTSNGNVVRSVMEVNIQTTLKGVAANQLQGALQNIINNKK